MNRRIFSSFIFPLLAGWAFAVSVTPAENLPEYYAAVNNQSGKNLFDKVHIIAKVGYHSLSYKGLWSAYKETDLRRMELFGICTAIVNSSWVLINVVIIKMNVIATIASTPSQNRGSVE